MSTTAAIIVKGALQLVGVIDPEETPTNAQAQDGLRRLNMMLGQWALKGTTIPASARQVFAIVAGKGSTTNPYTMGPTGDLVTTPRPLAILGAGLILGTPAPLVEVPLAVFTDNGWNGLAIKDLPSTQPTGVYYQPTYASGLGTLNLWPVPTITVNSLALYWKQPIANFANVTASYDLPQGADEPIEYGLAVRLARVYGAPLDPSMVVLAAGSLSTYKASNVEMSDLSQDFTPNARPGYNINTGA